MNYYLITYEVQYDGLEHYEYALVKASNEGRAIMKAAKASKRFGWEDTNTSVKVRQAQEITPEELVGLRLVATEL